MRHLSKKPKPNLDTKNIEVRTTTTHTKMPRGFDLVAVVVVIVMVVVLVICLLKKNGIVEQGTRDRLY